MTTVVECSDDIIQIKELSLNVRHSIKNIIEKEGFTSYTVSVKDISTNGGNYFGTLQTATIKGRTKEGEKELNLFLKNIIHVAEGNAPLNPSEVYLREGFFYKEIFKVFEKIQDEYNIPPEERINTIRGYSETNGDVIILEDVSKLGFKTYDRFDAAPLKFAELSIEQLAKLHALSFAIKINDPKYFDSNIKNLKTLIPFRSDMEIHMRKICDLTKQVLDYDAKTKLDIFFPKIREKYVKYLQVEADDPLMCLVHGDFRANNILVKEKDGEPVKVIPVDYQLAFYGYPIIDFIYFIFTATDQKFRKDHLEYLKDLYYSTFEIFLSKFGIEAKDVFSRKQFEAEYREKLDYGLIIFLALMPFIFASTEDIPHFENGIEAITFNLDDRYKDRAHGIIEDFIEYGCL